MATRFLYLKSFARADCLFTPFFRACLEPSSLNLYNQNDIPQIQAMLNFASFRKHLVIQPHDVNFAYNHGRTRNFRKMVIEATTRRLPTTQVTSCIFWKQFWALFFNHTQRNVIYRLIQGKIPTKLFLFHCNPSNNPHCALCLPTIESTAHFFFYCEEKQHFWDRLILEYLWPGCTLRMIMDALHSPNFTSIEVLQHKSSLDPSLLLIIAITEVWKAHWRFIFNATSLTSNSLLSSFRLSVLKMQSEDNLSSAQSTLSYLLFFSFFSLLFFPFF